MKKQFTTSFIATLFALSSFSQDVGYTTVDIGGGYQYLPDGMELNLHFAFNTEERHSFVVRGTYGKAKEIKTSLHNKESGRGLGGSIGYRYHFSVIPKRFFIGARLGLSTMKMNWSGTESTGSTRLLVFQPAVETGYTLVINDLFFITPLISGSYLSVANSKGEKVSYGNEFVPMAGITMGWRF